MEKNVGTVDKAVRVIIGIAILSLLYFLKGNIRWIGLVGVIPILTSIIGFCPLYRLFGLNTCPVRRKHK